MTDELPSAADEAHGSEVARGASPNGRAVTTELDPFAIAHRNFSHRPLTASFILNTVPKCGTVLFRNVLAMFVDPYAIHWPFQFAEDAERAWPPQNAPVPCFFTGHVERTVRAAAALRGLPMVVVVRDPVAYVLSHATFLYSEETRRGGNWDAVFTQEHRLPFADAVSLVIAGYRRPDGTEFVNVREAFIRYALAWAASGALLVRYEDMIEAVHDPDSPSSRAWLFRMLGHLGLTPPDDWRQRLVVGSSRQFSATVRENQRHMQGITPQTLLTPAQDALLDTVAPGLRESLGYGDAHGRLRRASWL